MPRTTFAEVRRASAADTVVRLAAARLWPNVPIDEIARAAGVPHSELVDAIHRHLRASNPRQPRSVARAPSEHRLPRGAPGPAPTGQKWCSAFGQWPGHFALLDDFGRNVSRPDGLSSECRAHWRRYWNERAMARHAAELASLEAQGRRRGRTPKEKADPDPAPLGRPSRPRRGPRKRWDDLSEENPSAPPPGQKWCQFGRHFSPIETFGKKKSNPNELPDTCRMCHRERDRKRREAARRDQPPEAR